jgi:hypothetical protein
METSRGGQDPPPSAPPDGQSPAGWYQDPQDPSRSRYWTGTAWTSWRRRGPGTRGPGTPPPPPPYRPLTVLAWAVVALLAADLVVTALSVRSDWGLLDLTNPQAQDAAAVADAEQAAWDARLSLLALLQAGLYLATGVAFVAWFHRAYQNLVAFGTEALRFTTGWAVGGWLVPILSLVRPKQLADDLWRATDPALPDQPGAAWKLVRVPPWLHAWWLLFVLWSAAGILARDPGRHPSLQQLRRVVMATLAGDVLALPAGVLACLVVIRITQRQRGRAAQAVAG